MKTKVAIIGITAGLLTSCSLNNAFLKRKYTKGMYIESIANTHQSNKHLVSKHFSSVQKESNTTFIQNSSNNSLSINNITENTITAQHSTVNFQKQNIHTFFKNHSQSKKSITTKYHNYSTLKDYADFTALFPLSKQILNKKSTAPSDEDKIILIILALFPVLCLIAIYLHDGKKITANFWVDLILHITLFGEVIFAILVVLDIINLA